MKYQKYRLLIEKLFKRQLTEKQAADLSKWLRSPEDKEGFDDMCHELWVNTPTAANDSVEAAMFANIQSRMDETETEKFSKRLSFYKIAAAALLVFCIGLGAYTYFIRKNMTDRLAEVVETKVEKGQKAQVILPDGTKVWLNSFSQLTYDGAFNQRERRVKLSGEAYFEVTKNRDKHFVVECEGVEIEALGTAFDVKAYPLDSTITTSLTEGRVRVSDKKSGITLEPNQQLIYNKKGNSFAVAEMDNINEADFWRKNILYFHSTPLGDIAKTIERMYDVKVVFASTDLARATFSGTIRNNSLENIFHIISLTYPMTCRFHEDTIYIKHR
ncbi:FecR domain-containing protein [Prevotella sp. A2931]|uniref:FecR domain-containing protein n=1 Tax=Prevotella illustrans TaxID=2800387 RepID=A0ABS3M4L6_9BACT|nr:MULTISPECIES: FecR domain-containing protein [Prevotella]MBO1363120.1 FecR domain-containing protein [Prevotella illustrans]PTL26157.1 iron dicitrate transport regulator FecR [Prevotella sp. oral taxon 820]